MNPFIPLLMIAVAFPGAAMATTMTPTQPRLTFHPDIVDLEAYSKSSPDIAGRSHTYILQLCVDKSNVVTEPPFPDESNCKYHEFVGRTEKGRFLLNFAEAKAYARAAKEMEVYAASREESARKALAAAPMTGPDYVAAGKAQAKVVEANGKVDRYQNLRALLDAKVKTYQDLRVNGAKETLGDVKLGVDVIVIPAAK